MPLVEPTESDRILVVDDDDAVRDVLRTALEREGFLVSEADSRNTMFAALDRGFTSLITLDLSLEQEDGLQLAREVRAARNVPIVMITGRAETVDRIIGLEHGADDYILKPFNVREVVLRIRAVLRRYVKDGDGSGSPPKYRFESGTLDTAKRELRAADGSLIELTDTEYQLLEMFLRHPSRILSRDEILRETRSRDWSPLDRTMDGHVARLRRKIEPRGYAPTLLKSVRGVGYVFTGSVSLA